MEIKTKTSSVKQLYDGDSFEIEPGDVISFTCCDCGLTHKFALAIEKSGNIGFALEADRRRTGQVRRYHEFPFGEKDG